MQAPLLDAEERASQAAPGEEDPIPELEKASVKQPFSHLHAVFSPHREHDAQTNGASLNNASVTRRPGLAQQTEDFFMRNDLVDDNGRGRQEQILTTDDYLEGDNPNPQRRREFLLRHTLSYWSSVSFMVGSEMFIVGAWADLMHVGPKGRLGPELGLDLRLGPG